MKTRKAVIVLGVLILGVLPAQVSASAAFASTQGARAAATKISTQTVLKATEGIGPTPGKVIFAINVKAASGATPRGTVSLRVDNTAPVTLTLKSTGRTSYTHHYKEGSHTATATYSGSTTDASSTTTIAFTVT